MKDFLLDPVLNQRKNHKKNNNNSEESLFKLEKSLNKNKTKNVHNSFLIQNGFVHQSKKKGKDNIQYNAGKINKLLDNINRNKRIGLSKNYNTTSNLNQKAFYNDYLYGNKKKIQGQEIDQKFLPYYKEIYGEATPEKDL